MLPFFSVVLPTYRRPEKLEMCLSALAKLDYPRDRFEVIVVDDGSFDSPESLTSRFHDRLSLTLIRQSNAGPAAARNAGAAHAKGAFLAFTDDDCAPDPLWLQSLARRFGGASDHMIGGKTINALPENPFSTASQQLIDYLYAYYKDDSKQTRLFVSNNMALSAEYFREMGGFDALFPLAAGEDRDFCDRWLHHGYKMTYAPEAVVYHAHTLTLRGFWRQHFNYGRGAFRFHQLRARRGQSRIRPEPLSFYLNLLLYPIGRVQGRRGVLIATLLGISQAANVAGFFWEKMNETGDGKENTTKQISP